MTDRVRLIPGDCLRAMRLMAALGVQVDSIVCDPPYHLTSIVKRFGGDGAAGARDRDGLYKRASAGFMGKKWDGGDIAFDPATWALAMAVLKPGGHLLAFGGTRGWHRMACAIEDAGFEIRDTVAFMYGSGFPKSHSCTKAIQDLSLREFQRDVGRLIDIRASSQDHCSDRCHLCDEQLLSASKDDLSFLRQLGDVPEHSHPSVTLRKIQADSAPKCKASCAFESFPLSKPDFQNRKDADAWQLLRDFASCLCLPCFARSILVASGDEGSPNDNHSNSADFWSVAVAVATSETVLRSLRIWSQSYADYIREIAEFQGWGTALKPAFEPIVMARKPLGEKSVAANVLRHGTGAVNVDGCRIYANGEGPAARVGEESQARRYSADGAVNIAAKPGRRYKVKRLKPGATMNATGGNWRPDDEPDYHGELKEGRWPANVAHDGSEEVDAAFAAFGENKGQFAAVTGNEPSSPFARVYGDMPGRAGGAAPIDAPGTAARFFYSAKAGPEDRFGSKHPTVKPVALIRWLQRLVTPPGGLTLDPFAGSGTAGVAAIAEGFRAIMIEADPEYQADIRERIAWATGEGRHGLAARARNAPAEKSGYSDLPLFMSPGDDKERPK